MKKKLIIFDMDGTLVNSSITIVNAINYVRTCLTFEPLSQEYILKRVNDPNINPAEIFYHSKSFTKEHEKLFASYYSKNHGNELVLYDGIKNMLIELKSMGFKLAVATNAYRQSTIESLTHLKVYDLFDSISCYDDVANAKPHPDMLYRLLDELNISIDDSLFIGDGPRDEMASRKAKLDYIMVNWGFSEHSSAVGTVDELFHILSKES